MLIVRRVACAAVAATLSTLAPAAADAAVALTQGATYTQDFNTLAATGSTGTALPEGWLFAESGTNANNSYGVGTGSSNAGNTWSYGATGSSDRAFGLLASGSLVGQIGASFVNAGTGAINALQIAFTAEQWRNGGSNVPNTLSFEYSTDATSLTTGSWTAFSPLDVKSIVMAANNGVALDGNAAANRGLVSATIDGLSLASGQTLFIRWTDANDLGADDGLAIDDFSLTPVFATGAVPEPATWAMMIAGFGAVGAAMRRRRNIVAVAA